MTPRELWARAQRDTVAAKYASAYERGAVVAERMYAQRLRELDRIINDEEFKR